MGVWQVDNKGNKSSNKVYFFSAVGSRADPLLQLSSASSDLFDTIRSESDQGR